MLIDRFIAREVLLVAGMSTATLSIVLVLGNVFREVCDLLVNHRIPLLAILDFVLCAAPFCLTYTLPWGFLTAIFLVFGRMAFDNELLAIRTSGIRIGRICLSVFAIALALSVLCFWINAEVNPRARLRMKEILHSLAISTLLNDTTTHQFIRLPNKIIYIGSQNAGHLRNIQIYEYDEESQLEATIVAKRGWIEPLEEKDEIVINLEEVTTDENDPTTEAGISSFRPSVSAHQLAYSVSLFELNKRYASTNYKALGSRTLSELKEGLEPGVFHSMFLTEFNKRISLSLACLAFTLAGIPMAILLHRRETTIGFGCGLAMACLYFVGFMIADNCRNNPAVHPELIAWASNGIFIPLGGMLFWRLAKR